MIYRINPVPVLRGKKIDVLLIRFTIIFILSFSLFARSLGQNTCDVRNTAFRAGEKIGYKIYYTVAGVYIAAGEVNFQCTLENFENKPAFHITATGKTYSFYDNFFKVRDKYESIMDTSTLQTYRFERNVYEGGTKKYENIRFNRDAGTVITDKGVFKVPECTRDVLGAMYYARNIDFDKLKTGDKIQFNIFLDNQLYGTYVRYLGREVIKTKTGKYNAIKFKPLLIKGTMFQAGEHMTVWVSDDPDHVPLQVESTIMLGKIRVEMQEFEGRRTPLSSRISNP
jgi:hypothetical protein